MKTALCLFVAIAAFALVQESAAGPLGFNLDLNLDVKKLITDTIDTVHNVVSKVTDITNLLSKIGISKVEIDKFVQILKPEMEEATEALENNVDPKKVKEDFNSAMEKLVKKLNLSKENENKLLIEIGVKFDTLVKKESTTGTSENTGATATDGSSANVGSDVTSGTTTDVGSDATSGTTTDVGSDATSGTTTDVGSDVTSDVSSSGDSSETVATEEQ